MIKIDIDSEEAMQEWFNSLNASFFELRDKKYTNLSKNDSLDNSLEDRVVAALKKESDQGDWDIDFLEESGIAIKRAKEDE